MREAPIYILIDSSTYLVGEPICLIKKELSELITKLRTDPLAIETMKLAFLTFGNEPKIVKPLTYLTEISLEFLNLIEFHGQRNLRDTFAILEEDIVNYLKPRKAWERDFDYRPFILVFIGGESSDWNENALSLLSTLSLFKKPEKDPDSCWDDDCRKELKEEAKESLCFCAFNEKVISMYSNIGDCNAVIGQDDIYSIIKHYF